MYVTDKQYKLMSYHSVSGMQPTYPQYMEQQQQYNNNQFQQQMQGVLSIVVNCL
jgi:hypothetical protein